MNQASHMNKVLDMTFSAMEKKVSDINTRDLIQKIDEATLKIEDVCRYIQDSHVEKELKKVISELGDVSCTLARLMEIQ